MRKNWLCSVVLVLGLVLSAAAQTIKLQSQVKLQNPSAVSTDRLGNVYVADQRRTLYKYAPDGQLLATYSPAVSGTVTSIEARSGVQILVFYADQQRVVILDRFLREVAVVNIPDLLIDGDLVKAFTFSGDNQYWLFNESAFALWKVDAKSFAQLIITPLNLILNSRKIDIRFMREYQNNLYVAERNSGVLVFDNMGNYKNTLPFKNLEYLGFLNDELYYLSGNELHFYHLYTHQQRILPLPAGANYQAALATERFIYLISPNGIDILVKE